MRLGQTVVKKGLRHLMHAAKFLRLLVTRDFRCASLSLGQRNIELFRLQFDCLEIGDVLDKREELEYVPSDVTAETIKKSLLGNYRKRRRVLVVKRAASPITVSFFLQCNIGGNDGNDVGICTYALDKGVHRLIPHAFSPFAAPSP